METLSLVEDIQLANKLRNSRRISGSTQRTPNFYNWWQSACVMLTYTKKGTMYDIFGSLEARTGMVFHAEGCQALFTKAADGRSPNPIPREYAKDLPELVDTLGLDYTQTPSKGRYGYRNTFFFRNPERARKILITSFPGLIDLFSMLDKWERTSNEFFG